ncbi:MAG: hypothetical protein FI687_07015 [SAR202 cluster bacterium]|nr:hypothetical protein [SAR202 cluster bacterium]
MLEFLQIFRFLLHYNLHLFLPGLIALIFFRKKWKLAWAIMLTTLLIDLDHLFANPIFDPNRCSIGFHPLHSYYAIGFYFLIFFIKNIYIKIFAIGLLLHIFTDLQDCLWIIFIT